jgi:arginase
MGVGPDALAPVVAETLREADHETCVELIESKRAFLTENGVGFELMRLIALRVHDALRVGELPVVLSGNCGVAVGTIAALGPPRTGVLWLDAHGEFNTPDTTRSAFLDGMGLTIATGRSWVAMAREIVGFAPLPDENVVLVGTRDLDAPERDALGKSFISVVSPEALGSAGVRVAVGRALQRLEGRVSRLYVHIDVDVFDERVAPSNEFGDERGLSLEHVAEVLATARDLMTIGAIGIASYDPGSDPDGRTPPIVASLVRDVLH